MGVFVLYDIYIKTYYSMKHLLNDLSEEERNSIREQHTGGMKVMTENFKKLINTKQGDVKTLLEQEDDEDESGVDDEVANDEVEPSTDEVKEQMFNNLKAALIERRLNDTQVRDFIETLKKYDSKTQDTWDRIMNGFYSKSRNLNFTIPLSEKILDLLIQIKNKY